MLKKAFTLVEIIIVVILSSILFTLLANVYILSSKLYVYYTNQKNIETDIIYFNQTLQNLVDTTFIDYDKYDGKLSDTLGFTGTLYLKDNEANEYKIYLKNYQLLLDMIKDGDVSTIPLTNTGITKVTSLYFKIIPFEDPFNIYSNNRNQPFIEVFLDLRIKHYNKEIWQQSVRYTLQEGFNFKYYNY